MGKPLTNKEFITKAISLHGQRYDYSKTNYIRSNKKLIIICNIHGEFEITGNDHLSKQGCQKCSRQSLGSKLRLTLDNVIARANIIHNNKYTYKNIINYKSNRIKVPITCPTHGDWLQSIDNHLAGYGCLKCSHNFPLTNETFIERSKLIHGTKYSYEEVIYKNTFQKVKIFCNKCSIFFNQRPNDHLSGKGCSICGLNASNKEIAWLNSLGIPNDADHRRVTLKINNKTYYADGFDQINNIVYEFNGDFWHGNPLKYKPDDINIKSKISFGQLYSRTIEKEKTFKNAGYKVISIWENDWDLLNKNRKRKGKLKI